MSAWQGGRVDGPREPVTADAPDGTDPSVARLDKNMVSSVVDTLGWNGIPVALADVVPVWAWVAVDPFEHRRRAGRGAIGRIEELHRLANLPHRLDVPDDGNRYPVASVVRTHAGVRRVIQSPARIHGVLAGPGPWERTAELLGDYVTIAPRVAIVDPESVERDELRCEALLWGVGLMTDTGLVTRPEHPVLEPGTYQWWQEERAYDAWLRSATTSESVA
jgi:hypothetical protein